jgi:hypothetical protein
MAKLKRSKSLGGVGRASAQSFLEIAFRCFPNAILLIILQIVRESLSQTNVQCITRLRFSEFLQGGCNGEAIDLGWICRALSGVRLSVRNARVMAIVSPK